MHDKRRPRPNVALHEDAADLVGPRRLRFELLAKVVRVRNLPQRLRRQVGIRAAWFALSASDLGDRPEIPKLDGTVVEEQNVVRLDVLVRDAQVVHLFQALKHARGADADLGLVQSIRRGRRGRCGDGIHAICRRCWLAAGELLVEESRVVESYAALHAVVEGAFGTLHVDDEPIANGVDDEVPALDDVAFGKAHVDESSDLVRTLEH